MNVIETRALTKRYGNKLAVDCLDMHVGCGEIYGFVGRNGAGKSTTLKMLSGLAHKTEGEATVLGQPLEASGNKGSVGVLIENPGLHPLKSAYENMMLKALCLGVVNPKQECLSLLEFVGLKDATKLWPRKFSMGMKQRLGLALALLGNPEVLLLDEPLNGLDPQGVRDIRELIISLNKERSITVVVSSHILEQLGKMATCYGVIRKGSMVREFTAEAMEEECRDFIRLRTSNPSTTTAILNEQLPSTHLRILDDQAIEVRGEVDTSRIASILAGTEVTIYELFICNRDIEDYFVEMMGDERNV